MFEIPELYEYMSSVRRKFVLKLTEISWDEVAKNREASFYSMRNIFVHMIDNEDWIVNWVIIGKSREYQREKKSDDYVNMGMVSDHLDKVEQRTRKYLSTFNEIEAKRRIDFVLSSSRSFDLSVEESLFQSFTEQLYHIGELIGLLWQENIEPPQMQWFWNNPRENKKDVVKAI